MLSDEERDEFLKRLVQARALDMPIASLQEAKEYLVVNNYVAYQVKLVEATLVLIKLVEMTTDAMDGDTSPVAPPQEDGFESGEQAVEYVKGFAAGIFKGIFGEDPRKPYETPPTNGKCYCGCNTRVKGWWAPGHDYRALQFIIKAKYPNTASFLKSQGYGPEADARAVAKSEYGSIAAFVVSHGYGPGRKKASE